MHVLMRAKTLLTFPGGFGTFAELFKLLTLIQTGKMARIPIVLFGTTFWRQAIMKTTSRATGAIRYVT
ncbi:hypothetical protein JI58_04510 [Marinosulfonomonas sp. PRT-SC04]|nr:hypothetical protein JI58_04510 [Marinosulfonomonas sp. PRT-SC04]